MQKPTISYTCTTSASIAQSTEAVVESLEKCTYCNGGALSLTRGQVTKCTECEFGGRNKCYACNRAYKKQLMHPCCMCGTLFCARCVGYNLSIPDRKPCISHKSGQYDCIHKTPCPCRCAVRLTLICHYTDNNRPTKNAVVSVNLVDERVRRHLQTRFSSDIVDEYGYRPRFKLSFRHFMLCWLVSQSGSQNPYGGLIPYELLSLVLEYAQPTRFRYIGPVFGIEPIVSMIHNMYFRGELYRADITLDVDGLCNGFFDLVWLPNTPIHRSPYDTQRKRSLLNLPGSYRNSLNKVQIFGGTLRDNIACGRWYRYDLWKSNAVLHDRFSLPSTSIRCIISNLVAPGATFTLPR